MTNSLLSETQRRIDKIYNAFYELERFIIISSQTPTENPEFWNEIQDKNSLSFFLLVFAQFDGFITDYTEYLVGLDESENMTFMKKVNIFSTTSDYKEIERLYQLRCDIAHGREIREIPTVAIDCEKLKQIAERIYTTSDYIFPE